jgi:exocyst complex component 5
MDRLGRLQDTGSIASQASGVSSGSGRTIFPKGPNFTLDNFSNEDFIVKDFIESLSETATASTRRSFPANQAFDPKPLIRTFEHAQRRLIDLSGDLEIRETELSTAVRRAEIQHAQNVESLGRKLDHAVGSFQRLDTSLSGSGSDNLHTGGNEAVKIGDRLEELDRQRRRALDAKFLIQCWTEVSERGELTSLENIRRSGSGEAKVRTAHIARQLMKISQRLDARSWNQVNGGGKYANGITNGVTGSRNRNTREIIEKFSESLEQDLLKQFDSYYRKPDFEGMKDCATVLYDFNGGASVIGLFVNQHSFFIERSQLITEEVASDSETWEMLADPDSESPGVEPSLQSLIDEVKVVVQEESGVIRRAFPFYDQVLTKFLQRVFQQPIQQRLEMVLEKANTVSSLAFLRSLQASKSYITALVDDLKVHGLTEHPDTVSSQIGLVLDQQLEDLFVPYFVGSSYIEKEKKNLEEVYSSLMFKFEFYHSRRKKAPTTFMAALAKSGSEMWSSAKDSYVNRLDSSDLTPTQKSMLLRVAGLKDAANAQKQSEPEVTEEDGMLNVAYAKRMLKWLAEGVGRGLELSGGTETPKDVSALLNMLLANMGERYVDVALDAASDAVAQESTKDEPKLSYLPGLHQAITIMHLMITCINTVLIPLAASNITTRRDMEKTTNLAINRMEDKVNSIMQRTVDAVLAWVTKLLSQQKRNDFKPRDDVLEDGSAWLEMLQTPVRSPLTSQYTMLTVPDMQLSRDLPLPPPQTHRVRPPPRAESNSLPNRNRYRPPHRAPRPLQEIPSQRHRRPDGHEGHVTVYGASPLVATGPQFRNESGGSLRDWKSIRDWARGVEGEVERRWRWGCAGGGGERRFEAVFVEEGGCGECGDSERFECVMSGFLMRQDLVLALRYVDSTC